METTEQVKTYSDFWYSPLLIFSLISDRRVNYVRKPSHLINVGFDQQCFQDFRTTFFQFELKVCFMRIRNLYILLFSSRLCDSGLKFMHGFCRGLTGTNISWGVPTTPDQTIQNRKKYCSSNNSLQFWCRSDCGSFSSDINVANQEIFLIGWKRFLGRKVLISVVIWIQRATD